MTAGQGAGGLDAAEPAAPDAAAARRLIEHLRGGVPLPPGEQPVTIGRTRLLERAAEALGAVADEGSRSLAVRANYGDGKTHALRAIWHAAARRGFVVSNVVLTRETPLDRLDVVYPRVVADTYLPGAGQPGIERLAEQVAADPEAVRRTLRFAADKLHPKLHAVLHNLLAGGSAEAAEPLTQDLAGHALALAELRRIHRGNFHAPLRLPRFSAARDAADYFRLVDFLVTAAGHPGWVILFDEAELISRLGRGGRAKAYAHVGRLAADGMGCRHLLTVFAVASNFYDGVLERRHDTEQAPGWLEARGDADGARWCRRGIAHLQGATALEPLAAAEWTDVMAALLRSHETAYGWSSGLTAERLYREVQRLAPETDTRVRTRLRLAIEWLDLMQQYGKPPQVRLASVGEVSLEPARGQAAAAREPM